MITEARRKEIEERAKQVGKLEEYSKMKEQITEAVMEFVDSFSTVLMAVSQTYKEDMEVLLAEIDRLKGELRKEKHNAY